MQWSRGAMMDVALLSRLVPSEAPAGPATADHENRGTYA